MPLLTSRVRGRSGVSRAGALLVLLLLTAAVGPASGAGLIPEQVRVAVSTGRSSLSVGATGQFEVVAGPAGTIIARGPGSEAAGLTVTAVGEAVSIDGGLYAGPLTVRPSSGSQARVTLSGRPFRGILEIRIGPDGGLLVMNEVNLEDYLLGVIPREMPASWPEEALKAQAVAARTYAASQVLAARASGATYDLLATSDSQVYGGVEAEQPATDRAVASTRGVVITYGGELISAVYHSSSGGHTEDSENIWVSCRPYLRGVPDYDQASPKYTWERDMTVDDITARLAAAGYLLGTVAAVEPSSELGVSGRPLRVTFRGSAGAVTLKGEEARRVLGLPSSWFDVKVDAEGAANLIGHMEYGQDVVVAGAANGAPNQLTRRVGQSYCLSCDGTLWRVSDYTILYNRTVVGCVRLEGHGWGHGVGLSQWGARSLAEDGWSYGDILRHYYTGVALEQR